VINKSIIITLKGKLNAINDKHQFKNRAITLYLTCKKMCMTVQNIMKLAQSP